MPEVIINGPEGRIEARYTPSNNDVLDYIKISSGGNAVDFGDLTSSISHSSTGSSQTRGIFACGRITVPGTAGNVIDYITMATTGDAKDFGDADPSGSPAGNGMGDFPSCMSDSHGGVA